ncbi:hypothetical protein ACS5PN_03845 [Roseateles sp. NT4]|uniref:hypothetical protein n=1 Tax=Roseateles sp. NT4 TaxID=3453715 RepID=UPI003EF062C8
MVQVVTVTQQQDTLRPIRNFVSLLAGATADQTYADADYWAGNPSGQFVSQSPNGMTAREGQPVYVQASATATSAGIRTSSPEVLWLLAAVAAYMFLK